LFITRATRHDRDDVTELLAQQGWHDSDLTQGTTFIARDGLIAGCVRLIEVEPRVVIVDDMLVREDRRRQGFGSQLMRAAMNSRGGTLYLSCHDDTVAFYERFGFSEISEEDLPPPVVEYMKATNSLPNDRPDHVHHFLKAR
jgi:N-acetylglutamate synthase-like GNAT family acetyltransferase